MSRMSGSKSSKVSGKSQESGLDVAKLFFDSFSTRVSQVELGLRTIRIELEKMKASSERSQISDLVLLERIQRAEGLLEESLNWIKRVAELGPNRTSVVSNAQVTGSLTAVSTSDIQARAPLRQIVSPSGEAGSLSSITTPTEMQVLSLLAERAPLAAPEIGRQVGRSREHTARLMKRLYEEGYVKRDHNRIPFRYSLVDRVRQSFARATTAVPKEEGQDEGEKDAVVAQSPPA